MCSFRLVLEGKAGKDIPESAVLDFLKKILVNNFIVSDAENNAFMPLSKGIIVHFTFVKNTIGSSLEVTRAKILGSDRFFCFIRISKFGSFKVHLAMITSLSEPYFRSRRLQ